MTADRKPDTLPTTSDGAPVASLAPGPLPVRRQQDDSLEIGDEEELGEESEEAEGDSMEVDQRIEV